jgi:hypothetical protein
MLFRCFGGRPRLRTYASAVLVVGPSSGLAKRVEFFTEASCLTVSSQPEAFVSSLVARSCRSIATSSSSFNQGSSVQRNIVLGSASASAVQRPMMTAERTTSQAIALGRPVSASMPKFAQAACLNSPVISSRAFCHCMRPTLWRILTSSRDPASRSERVAAWTRTANSGRAIRKSVVARDLFADAAVGWYFPRRRGWIHCVLSASLSKDL